MTMPSHKRILAVIDTYGADPLRWPQAQRSSVEVLLRISEPARAHLEAARLLDASIRDAARMADAHLWGPGDQEAALARVRSLVGASISLPTPSLTLRPAGWFAALTRPSRGLGLAVGCSLAVAAGFFMGSTHIAIPTSHNVLGIFQPALLQMVTD